MPDQNINQDLDWKKGNGLLPVIVQHAQNAAILMTGYMNAEAFAKTKETGHVTFFSRSKNRLWTKGETSGHFLNVDRIFIDCDRDAILIHANPIGPTCHLETESCFGDGSAPLLSFLPELAALISQRKTDMPQGSYTTKLFQSGAKRIAQKVGEEGLETALAHTSGDREETISESADLIFHLLVLLEDAGLSLEDVIKQLKSRHQAS